MLFSLMNVITFKQWLRTFLFDGLAGFPFCMKPELLPQVERRIAAGKLSLQSLAESKGHLFCISESDRPQMENINTPEQLAAARARLQ